MNHNLLNISYLGYEAKQIITNLDLSLIKLVSSVPYVDSDKMYLSWNNTEYL